MTMKTLILAFAALVWVCAPAQAQDTRESTYNLQSSASNAVSSATSKVFNSSGQSGSSQGAVPFNLNRAVTGTTQDPFSLTPEQIREQQIENSARLQEELLNNRQQFEQRLAERRALEGAGLGNIDEFGNFIGDGNQSLLPDGQPLEDAPKKKKKRVYRGKGDGFEKPQRVFNSVR